jgi:hypothetical protein
VNGSTVYHCMVSTKVTKLEKFHVDIMVPDGGTRTINRDPITEKSVPYFTTETSQMCLHHHFSICAIHHRYNDGTIKLEEWSVIQA